ncbi:MAG: histidine phosphotransferase [Desulfobulbus propionicus]|nr:MAG: histidine phosphotransferase [Desulfobulbus propionicus]
MMDLKWNRKFALEQTDGDSALLDELITLFKESAASDFLQLKEAVADRNATAIIAAAHSLKGASASLGIEGIREIAYEIETAARNNTLENIASHIPDMENLVQQLQEIE